MTAATASPRYRRLNFGIGGVHIEPQDNGAIHVKVAQPLEAYPKRLMDRLRHWAAAAPERTFLAKRGRDGEWVRIGYADALRRARHIGQSILARGLSPHRPVLILSDNDLEHAMLALGCQYAGVPYSAISPAYSLLSKDYDKLRHVVKLLSPGMVFAAHGETFAAAVEACVPAGVEFVVTEAPPAGRPATLFAALLDCEPTAELEAVQAATNADTIVKFLFTSGSTKMPKAVINTQRMMCSNLQMMAQCWPFLAEEPPVLVDWLPWNHTFGGNHNLGLVLYNGGTMYIDEGRPTPQGMAATLRNLREIAPTVYFNVPKGWEDLAYALEADPELSAHFHSRLRMQFYAAAALPQTIWDKLHAVAERTIGERIVMNCGLGMTETAPSAMFVVQEQVRAGQIGVPLPGITIKLLSNGDKTEVRYKGPNVTPGYWRDPEQTSAAFDEEGFFCSGDAVRWYDPDQPDLGFVFDGRVAEDFKLYTGTWVSVGPLRGRVIVEGAPCLQDVVITGHDRKELGLLLLPNLAQCRKLAALGPDAGDAEVLAAPAVRAFFQQMVTRLHAQGTGSANRVERALILLDPPNIDKGEITDKGTINQRAVLQHRAALVEALYGDTDPAIIKPDNA
ncbi:feruloyl-CoA synthase [Pseudoduganella namucuonensis]|uniref:Trans-feruloyl-CoA synthase n=1 Tax=Pseudoduganella namucuonensis TaxID=1035707 RepID=A0A1I7L7H1_9BURK|nr:feruloyl-CoA synthase [Pseudoduganella namucuonensis]SFV05661.1 trans-feruloyl-CoA synthase [Pseudoduganella namucuonensis]